MSKVELTKKVDNLGRVVIPKAVRLTLGIKEGDPLLVSLDKDKIILSKQEKRCASCGTTKNLAYCENIVLCLDCAKRISDSIVNFEKDKE